MKSLLDALLDVAPLTGEPTEDAVREAAAELLQARLPDLGVAWQFRRLDEDGRRDVCQAVLEKLQRKGPRRRTMASPPEDEAAALAYLRRALHNEAISDWRRANKSPPVATAPAPPPDPVDWETVERVFDQVLMAVVESARTDDAADHIAEDLRQAWELAKGTTDIVALAGSERAEGAEYDRIQKRIYRARKRIVATLDTLHSDDPAAIALFREVFSRRVGAGLPRRRHT